MEYKLYTVEMMSELRNDRTKKFKRVHDGMEISAPKGQLVWESGHDFISLSDDEWVEVDQSVDFITAVKSEDKVRLEHKYLYKIIKKANKYYLQSNDSMAEQIYEYIKYLQSMIDGEYVFFNRILHVMSLYMDTSEIREIILNAKWYLKEGN